MIHFGRFSKKYYWLNRFIALERKGFNGNKYLKLRKTLKPFVRFRLYFIYTIVARLKLSHYIERYMTMNSIFCHISIVISFEINVSSVITTSYKELPKLERH